jgi:hypothetical protein
VRSWAPLYIDCATAIFWPDNNIIGLEKVCVTVVPTTDADLVAAGNAASDINTYPVPAAFDMNTLIVIAVDAAYDNCILVDLTPSILLPLTPAVNKTVKFDEPSDAVVPIDVVAPIIFPDSVNKGFIFALIVN